MKLNNKLVLWIILIFCGSAYGYLTQYYVSNRKLVWFDARDACKAMGLTLTCTTTSVEKLDLEDYLREHSLVAIDDSGYWIGSHRNSSNNPWIWESNGQQINGFGWLLGEPNYHSENCVELKKKTAVGIGWNNLDCGEKRRYICESLSDDPIPTEPDSPSTTDYPNEDSNNANSHNDNSHNSDSHNIYFLMAVFGLLFLTLLCATYIVCNHFCMN